MFYKIIPVALVPLVDDKGISEDFDITAFFYATKMVTLL